EILNKRIIEEEHKRSAAPVGEQEAVPATDRFVDLSHVIEDGLITYRGLPGPVIIDHITREDSRDYYAEGTEFQIGRIEMVGNTGTYLDMPFHRYPAGADLAGVVLEKVSNVPGVVVRVTGMEESAIDWHHFAPIDCDGHAVLVHTDWDRHWGSEQYFDPVHPHLTEKAVECLVDQGAALVGIDSVNIDDTTTGTRPAHSVLLAAEIPVVEHLTNLGELPTSGFRFSAVPPMISGMGTFPVRAHARIPVAR
ncbi:MAG: cyclase family protein, partial [Acidimicrobiia bacterium]|nr:cyclase family protein [Acidimicrobiia bacterium]